MQSLFQDRSTLLIAAGLLFVLLIYLLIKRRWSDMSEGTPGSFIKGFGYLISNNLEAALNELTQVALEESGSADVYITLGTLFRRKGEFAKAIHIHESVVGREDLSLESKSLVLAELAEDYRIAGMPEKAIGYLQELQRTDKSPKLFDLLGEVSYEMEDYPEAIKYFNKYSKKSSEDRSRQISYCYVRIAELNRNNPSKFKKMLKSAIGFFPQNHAARYLLAAAPVAAGKSGKGMEELKKIVSDGIIASPQDIQFIEDVFFGSKAIDSLVEIMTNIKRNSSNPFIHLFVANYLVKTGKKGEAIKTLKEFTTTHGPKMHVLERYAELTEDPVISSMLGNSQPYCCSNCNTKYYDYYEQCGNCKHFETVNPC